MTSSTASIGFMVNSRRPKSSVHAKVAWLAERPDLWKHLPSEAPYYLFRDDYNRLASLLKLAGLFAKRTASTGPLVPSLVTKARELLNSNNGKVKR